ncbi:MAG: hypothetical protein IKS33_00985 [Bacteroidales bacterium]|nr:hypothetical protein [Bacteroidales bacterium]
MGMPSTKAECDRKIAELEGQLERKKAELANVKRTTAESRRRGTNVSCTGAVNGLNCTIASIKAEIAKVKAYKKKCKS